MAFTWMGKDMLKERRVLFEAEKQTIFMEEIT